MHPSKPLLCSSLLLILLASPADAIGSATPIAGGNADGRRVWSRQFGSGTDDVATGVATDGAGNVVVTGATDGSLDGTNRGESDAFLAKIAPDGTMVWLRQLGSGSRDGASSTAIDRHGNIVIAGLTFG